MLIDWFTVIAQTANFLILVWLMKRYLYQPVLAAIDAREARIAAALKDAEEKKTTAAQQSEHFRQMNEAFEQGRDALLKTAREDANVERQRLLETARQDAEALRAKLAAAVQSERETLGRELATRVELEVFAIARQTLADLAAVSIEAQICKVFAERLRTLDQNAKAGLGAALKTSTEAALVRSAFEIPAGQREEIRQALKEVFGTDVALSFEIAPDLVCGIELGANGHKVAWSIASYLTALDRRVNELLAPADHPETAPDATAASMAAPE